MTTRCYTENCPHGAKYAPKICIPAQGWPIGTHKPIELICGLKMCKECVDKMKPEEWLAPDIKAQDGSNAANLRQIITAATAGHMPPDFDRAWIEPLLLSSKEFAHFEKGLNAAAPGVMKDGGTVH